MAVWEIIFRAFLLRRLLQKHPWPAAVFIHLIFVNLAGGVLVGREALKWETLGLFRFFLNENLFESFLALFFLRTGSLWAVTFLHAAVNFVRFGILNDVAGPFETFYFYSAASDSFYWLISGVLFAALLLQGILNHWLGTGNWD